MTKYVTVCEKVQYCLFTHILHTHVFDEHILYVACVLDAKKT